jgi:hypothetical protein
MRRRRVRIMKPQYDPKTDAVIYSPATAGFRSGNWVLLALAALDQAGLTPTQLCDASHRAKNSDGICDVLDCEVAT